MVSSRNLALGLLHANVKAHTLPHMSDSEPVVIPALMLSDHVVREAGTQKLTLVGIFSAWNCSKFPFPTPRFWVTVFLTNIRTAAALNLTVRIEDRQSGHVLASMAAKVEFQDAVLPPNTMVEIPLPVGSMMIPSAGTYRVVALVNDEKISERTFVVTSLTSATEIK